MGKVQYVCGEHAASYKCVTSFGRTAAILFSGYAQNAKGTTVFDKLCAWNGLKKKETLPRAESAYDNKEIKKMAINK